MHELPQLHFLLSLQRCDGQHVVGAGCAREVAAVAALLSVRSAWVSRRGEEALLDEQKAR